MGNNMASVDELVAFYGEGGIVPTREQWRRIVDSTHEGSICMINFIKVRDRAAYADGSDPDLSGIEAMLRYLAVSQKKVADVGGEFVVQGMNGGAVIGNDESWDMIGIVRYPHRRAFLQLFADPEYREGHRHRVAATAAHRMVMLLEARVK